MSGKQKYSPELTQERDYPLLEMIYRYDGMLSFDQVHRWFFASATRRRMEIRIKQLCDGGYLCRALMGDGRYNPPEPIVWLGRPGAQVLASYLGVDYQHLPWRNQPKSSRIAHDIALNEFRWKLERALMLHPRYTLERWRGQDELSKLFTRPVAYFDEQGRRQERIYRADGLVSIHGGSYRLHCPIEYDNDTFHNHQRFAREKVSPGVHWMLSDDYQSEIGTAGRFLVVVAAKSREHFDNLRAEVTRVGGAGYQLFVWDQGITAESVLSAPIWYLSHLEEPVSFEQYDTPDFLHYVEQTLTDPGNPVPRLKLLRGA